MIYHFLSQALWAQLPANFISHFLTFFKYIIWQFPYPRGLCNPVRIYGRKINMIWYMIWYDITFFALEVDNFASTWGRESKTVTVFSISLPPWLSENNWNNCRKSWNLSTVERCSRRQYRNIRIPYAVPNRNSCSNLLTVCRFSKDVSPESTITTSIFLTASSSIFNITGNIPLRIAEKVAWGCMNIWNILLNQ